MSGRKGGGGDSKLCVREEGGRGRDSKLCVREERGRWKGGVVCLLYQENLNVEL